MPNEDGVWVQVDIVDASLPVSVEDIVAALWVAAERGELHPTDLTGPDEGFADLARPTVLYLLLNDHAGILAARHRLAGLAPGTQLHALADQVRAYAEQLFLPAWDVDIPDVPDFSDIPDYLPDDFDLGGGSR